MISILCITKGEPHAEEFISDMAKLAKDLEAEFVVGADGIKAYDIGMKYAHKVIPLISKGYLESVYKVALGGCTGDYIFRLDDDEKSSDSLKDWLKRGVIDEEVYSFPRANLWEDGMITTPPLWPDVQTRLTKRTKAGGRDKIHVGSPWGSGVTMPFMIAHYKFLVRSYVERFELACQYEKIKEGCGFGSVYAPYNVPEKCFEELTILPFTDGYIKTNPIEMIGKGKVVEIHEL